MIESEAHSQLCQTSTVEYFAKIVNGFNYFQEKLHPRDIGHAGVLNMFLRIYSNYIPKAPSIVEYLNQ